MTWRRDAWLAPAAELLPHLRVLSLDVFDTLLHRTCASPEDVFVEVGRRAASQGWLRTGIRPEEFGTLRRLAQETTYAALEREPRLEDIYAALPDGLCDRDELLQLELEVEADTCALNPVVNGLVAACNSAGIPVVLLSDMYLGGERVKHLLARAGFDVATRVEHVFVSVDENAYKMTGALYGRLLERYPDVEPGRILHIGDNLHADVRMARAAGLRALHYDVVRHDPDGTFCAEHLVHGSLLPEVSYLRRLAASSVADVRDDDRAFFRAGAQVIGPLASALVEWTLDICDASGITLVAPLMREAHVFTPMLRRAAAARGLAIDVAPLFVSRHAVALAGVSDVERDLASVLLDRRRDVTVAELYGLVQLPVPAAIAAHASVAIDHAYAVDIGDLTLREWIADHVTSAPVRTHMESVVASARATLSAYLTRIFGAHTRVATLDIGFYGSVQHALSNTLAVGGSAARLTHLLAFAHGPAAARLLRGMDVRTFAGGYGVDGDLVKTIHRAAPVIEQLLQGPDGSTLGYTHADDRVIPVIGANALPARDLTAKAATQAGVDTFHDMWLALRDTQPSVVARVVERRGDWCRLVHRLIQAPTYAEAAALGGLHDEVNYGSMEVLPFCPPHSEADVSTHGADSVVREGFPIPVIWPQGVVSRVDAGAVIAPYAAMSLPYAGAALTLARTLRARGITRVVGYGTGDVAHAFIDACRIVGVDLPALVDSQSGMHGLRVRGIDVCSLDAAVATGIHVYAVLSFAHASVIADAIERRYDDEASTALVFDLTLPRAS